MDIQEPQYEMNIQLRSYNGHNVQGPIENDFLDNKNLVFKNPKKCKKINFEKNKRKELEPSNLNDLSNLNDDFNDYIGDEQNEITVNENKEILSLKNKEETTSKTDKKLGIKSKLEAFKKDFSLF